MLGMLGNQYTVLEVVSDHVPVMIGLPSPDGSQNGTWYFTVNVVSKAGT